tara:strand:- start:218 stop:703 length:486 start_codon:yes stop_codon:yes gene_type:complete
MYKVIDNYLDIDQHIILKTIMEAKDFPWYFTKGKVKATDNPKLFDYQFNHIFYVSNNINSNYFNNLEPILHKLKPLSLIRIKANLNPPTENIIESDYHTDQKFKCKIALYYLNDNDGYTVIGKEKILSKANRMVLFTSESKHFGTNSTNCNNRIVINFNYF